MERCTSTSRHSGASNDHTRQGEDTNIRVNLTILPTLPALMTTMKTAKRTAAGITKIIMFRDGVATVTAVDTDTVVASTNTIVTA